MIMSGVAHFAYARPFWYITSGNHRYQRAFVGIHLALIAIAMQQSALLSLSDAI